MVLWFLLSNKSSACQDFPKTNCPSPTKTKINQGVGQAPSPIPLICPSDAKANGDKFLGIGPTQVKSGFVWYDEYIFAKALEHWQDRFAFNIWKGHNYFSNPLREVTSRACRLPLSESINAWEMASHWT